MGDLLVVDQKLAGKIAHSLANYDDDLTVGSDRKVHGLDMGIDHHPLPGPVAPQTVVALHVAAVLAVGPLDVGMDAGEDAVDVTGVEALVDAPEERQLVEHRAVHSSLMLAVVAT